MVRQENGVATDALYSVGHWLLSQSRERDAAELFRVFARAQPADERAWLGLSECHARLEQPLVALEIAGAGSVVAVTKTRLHLQRARLLRSLDRDDEAGEALARARDESGDDDELLALVGREERR